MKEIVYTLKYFISPIVLIYNINKSIYKKITPQILIKGITSIIVCAKLDINDGKRYKIYSPIINKKTSVFFIKNYLLSFILKSKYGKKYIKYPIEA